MNRRHPDPAGVRREAARAFKAEVAAYLDLKIRRFPQWASAQGLDAYQGHLGRNDPDFHRAHLRTMERTLSALEAIPPSALDPSDRLDRRALVSHLRVALLEGRDLERWRNNPQEHVDTAIQSVFDPVVRNARRLGPVAPHLLSRLRAVPRFLREGLACLHRPVPLWSRAAVRTALGAVEFLRGLQPELAPHVRRRGELERVMAGACEAFVAFAGAVRRMSQGAAGGFAVGRERFEFLIREQTGLSLSAAEARAEGERWVRTLEYELEGEARRSGHESATEVIGRLRQAWDPGEGPLINAYRDVTARLRHQLARRGWVGFPPGERLRILPVPAFLRHQFPTAAYSSPPPWARRQEGIFWVNDLGVGQRDPNRRLEERRQHFGLELTCLHEAYPGHHLQFATANRHPSRLRRLFAHAIAYEGWTLWCEKWAVDRGLVRGRYTRLLQLHDALWRAHRVVIDCGLHTEGWSFRRACRRLEEGVGFTRARAEADVTWYTAAPTVPMSYLLGRLEVEKLYADRVLSRGWSLRQFHDWLLSHGTLPWSWIVQESDASA